MTDSREIIDLVLGRELELGVVGASRGAPSSWWRPSPATRSSWCARPRTPGRAPARVGFDELLREPLIVQQPGSGVRAVVDAALRARGVNPAQLNVFLELGLNESVKHAVIAGAGVTYLSKFAVRNELRNGTLATVRVADFQILRDFSVVRSRTRAMSKAMAAFLRVPRSPVRAALVGPPAVSPAPPDLAGNVVLLTGATSGIGKAAAARLALSQATLVLVARDRARGLAVRDELVGAAGNERIEVIVADLSLPGRRAARGGRVPSPATTGCTSWSTMPARSTAGAALPPTASSSPGRSITWRPFCSPGCSPRRLPAAPRRAWSPSPPTPRGRE